MTEGRFIAIESIFSGKPSVIIKDYVFWIDNLTAIDTWLETYKTIIKQEGMIVHFDSEEVRTLFLLKWS